MAPIKQTNNAAPQRVRPAKATDMPQDPPADENEAEEEEEAEQDGDDADQQDDADQSEDTEGEETADEGQQDDTTDEDADAAAEADPNAPQRRAEAVYDPNTKPPAPAPKMHFQTHQKAQQPPARPKSSQRPYLETPQAFGVHLPSGHLKRFNKGRTLINDLSREDVKFLKQDSYVRDHGGEVVDVND